MKTNHFKRILCLLSLMSTLGTACAQLFVVTNDFSGIHNCAILKYDFDGTYLDTILLPNNDAQGLATDGTNLYVSCYSLGTVAKYTTTGALVNPAIISGLTSPFAMAVSGTNLFVASNQRIGKYTTDGAAINPTLISTPEGIDPAQSYGLAIIGTNLFATYPDNRIAEYTTDGVIVNETLVTGLSHPIGLGTDGTNLYVVNKNDAIQSGWIGKYTALGNPIAIQFVSNLGQGAANLAINGTNLYVVYDYYNNLGTIGKYTTTLGNTITNSLIAGRFFSGIVAIGFNSQSPLPPPAVGILMYSNQPVVVWPDNGGNYTLETTTNLASGNWTAATNYLPVTGAMMTNASSPAFFRLTVEVIN